MNQLRSTPGGSPLENDRLVPIDDPAEPMTENTLRRLELDRAADEGMTEPPGPEWTCRASSLLVRGWRCPARRCPDPWTSPGHPGSKCPGRRFPDPPTSPPIPPSRHPAGTTGRPSSLRGLSPWSSSGRPDGRDHPPLGQANATPGQGARASRCGSEVAPVPGDRCPRSLLSDGAPPCGSGVPHEAIPGCGGYEHRRCQCSSDEKPVGARCQEPTGEPQRQCADDSEGLV